MGERHCLGTPVFDGESEELVGDAGSLHILAGAREARPAAVGLGDGMLDVSNLLGEHAEAFRRFDSARRRIAISDL